MRQARPTHDKQGGEMERVPSAGIMGGVKLDKNRFARKIMHKIGTQM